MLNQNRNHPGAILKSSKPTATWSCAGERERPTKHKEIAMIYLILFEVSKKETYRTRKPIRQFHCCFGPLKAAREVCLLTPSKISIEKTSWTLGNLQMSIRKQ